MHDELMRRLRFGDLQRLIRWRYGHTLPNDDAGTEDLVELLLPISLGNNPEDRMRRAIEIWAPWVSPSVATDVIHLVNSIPTRKRRPPGNVLGARMCYTLADHQRLMLRTIRPCDVSDEELTEWRKKRSRDRKAEKRRQSGAKTRQQYLATSKSRLKPWEAEGISRATWYRRRETSVSHINFTDTGQTCLNGESERGFHGGETPDVPRRQRLRSVR